VSQAVTAFSNASGSPTKTRRPARRAASSAASARRRRAGTAPRPLDAASVTNSGTPCRWIASRAMRQSVLRVALAAPGGQRRRCIRRLKNSRSATPSHTKPARCADRRVEGLPYGNSSSAIRAADLPASAWQRRSAAAPGPSRKTPLRRLGLARPGHH
jgi:hypothetical protein